jgi:predicted nucleic acid-binding protein
MVESIADTGFVAAVGNQSDKWHQACATIYRRENVIYLPQTILAEVGYMLGRELGNRAFANFLRRLPETKYRVMALEMQDFLRTAEILEQYADTRVDFVDATVVAVAERLKITRILTLDQRDFHIVRPSHSEHFEILPSP